jgi:hypothetical protein
VDQQVEDQDGTEYIEHDPPHGAAVNGEGLPQGEARPTQKHDRKQIVGERDEEGIEIHDVSPQRWTEAASRPLPRLWLVLLLVGVDGHQIKAVQFVGELEIVERLLQELNVLLLFGNIEQVLDIEAGVLTANL